jgi:acetoin utilization deacetylase AcuC-like enzyme
MARTGFVFHGDCLAHRAGLGHPERPERVTAIADELRRSDLWSELDHLEPTEVARTLIEAVHDAEYVDRVAAADRVEGSQLDPDTRAGKGSDRAARLTAGGVVQAIDRVVSGAWSNAFVACRPPGHHAERAQAMGFCLYNHAAIAAAYLREHHGIERVAVLDWDVHHGNGTQHLFESDPTVFYASLHQYPHYPGTGAADERGRGDGEGATLNCPMPAGSGGPEWMGVLETRVLPALEAFRPGFVLVSAGFDAHRDDPLAGCLLDEEDYRRMTRRVVELANRSASGRIVSLLEGGYDLRALARSAAAHTEELHAAPAPNDAPTTTCG